MTRERSHCKGLGAQPCKWRGFRAQPPRCTGLGRKQWLRGPYCTLCNVSDASRYYDPDESECLLCEGSAEAPLLCVPEQLQLAVGDRCTTGDLESCFDQPRRSQMSSLFSDSSVLYVCRFPLRLARAPVWADMVMLMGYPPSLDVRCWQAQLRKTNPEW